MSGQNKTTTPATAEKGSSEDQKKIQDLEVKNKELENALTAVNERLSVVEESFNSLIEKNEAQQKELDMMKDKTPKAKVNYGIDRRFEINGSTYALKFPRVQDAQGKVDFRELNDAEVIDLYDRFSNVFVEV